MPTLGNYKVSVLKENKPCKEYHAPVIDGVQTMDHHNIHCWIMSRTGQVFSIKWEELGIPTTERQDNLTRITMDGETYSYRATGSREGLPSSWEVDGPREYDNKDNFAFQKVVLSEDVDESRHNTTGSIKVEIQGGQFIELEDNDWRIQTDEDSEDETWEPPTKKQKGSSLANGVMAVSIRPRRAQAAVNVPIDAASVASDNRTSDGQSDDGQPAAPPTEHMEKNDEGRLVVNQKEKILRAHCI
ncbi:hypothetical protein CALVIDRAFT_554234, partial [Calocera viscosa TUFC12733]